MKENIVKRTIMWGDLDALGIVFYPRYYEWIDAAGHQFFDALELNLNRLWKERNILFGLVESNCRYFKPGRYHRKIEIVTRIESLAKKTLDLRHRIRDHAESHIMVEGIEKRICMDVSDSENFSAIDIPKDIHRNLKAAMA